MPFKNLFRRADKPTDGLDQAAREAVVDVLHYCMYADKHISVDEDAFIEAAARTLDWDPKISYEYYEGKSTGEVRRVLADKSAKEQFFQTLRDRLKKPEHRKLALSLADDLSKADGEKKQVEYDTLRELRQALGA